VALSALLEAADIDPALLADQDATLPLTKIAALFEFAAQTTQDPCFGLNWAEAYEPGATGAFGYLVLNARSLREAMKTVAHYLSLVIDPAHVTYIEDASQGSLSWHLPAVTTASNAQYIAFSAAATTLRLRGVAGSSWSPIAVELSLRELPCTETVRRIFGSNVHLSAPINAIHAGIESLSLKAAGSGDQRLFEIMEQLGQRLLAERAAPSDLVTDCQKAIINRLSQGDVTLDLIAGSLVLTPRTLQGRLAQANETFDGLLQETRKELATGYLRDTDLPMTDIAHLLGFSELSVFSRAVQRWFGVTPSAYRQLLRSKLARV